MKKKQYQLMCTYLKGKYFISTIYCNKKLEKYDYVSIPKYKYLSSNQEVINGFILQVDEKKGIDKM